MAKGKNGGSVAKRTTKLVPAKTLTDLLKASRHTKESIVDLTTDYAGKVAKAVDEKHLHKKAYNVIRMLDRMTPEKLADFKEHFDHMYEASGLAEREASAPRLEMGEGDEKEESEEEETGKGKGASITKFPAPQGQA